MAPNTRVHEISRYNLESRVETIRQLFRVCDEPRPSYDRERKTTYKIILGNQRPHTLIEIHGRYYPNSLIRVNRGSIDIWCGNVCYRASSEAFVSWQVRGTMLLDAVSDKGEEIQVPVEKVSLEEGILHRGYYGILPGYTASKLSLVEQNPKTMVHETYLSLARMV